jgi:hypothetical protein
MRGNAGSFKILTANEARYLETGSEQEKNLDENKGEV